MSERGDSDFVNVGDTRHGRSSAGYFTFEEVKKIIEKVRAESLEMVENPPESLRTEYGYGMANGQLRAARRFDTLLDELLRGQYMREEAFDKGDDWNEDKD